MSRPRLLDLFCGAGGAAMGYHRAGFDVVGVDIKPQPHYPFEFHQGDAMTIVRTLSSEWAVEGSMGWLNGFDAVHASPPCQGYSPHVTSQSSQWVPTAGMDEPRLIGPLRERLRVIGLPYVIENVYGARSELDWPTFVCGTGLSLPIHRHRLFEVNGRPGISVSCHRAISARGYAEEMGWDYRDMTVTGKGRRAGTADRWREIMGIDWPTTQHELAEAIPPAFTEWIGQQLMRAL